MFDNFEDDAPESKWPIIKDLFSSVIKPAKDWPEADCLGDINDMAMHFRNAFPEQIFTIEDLRLALHDMNIKFERNENNNKYYYLATWL
jgi:hypothetical protein